MNALRSIEMAPTFASGTCGRHLEENREGCGRDSHALARSTWLEVNGAETASRRRNRRGLLDHRVLDAAVLESSVFRVVRRARLGVAVAPGQQDVARHT